STTDYTVRTGGWNESPTPNCSADKSLHSNETDSLGYHLLGITLNEVTAAYSSAQQNSIYLNFSDVSFTSSSLTDSGFNNFNVSKQGYTALSVVPLILHN